MLTAGGPGSSDADDHNVPRCVLAFRLLQVGKASALRHDLLIITAVAITDIIAVLSPA